MPITYVQAKSTLESDVLALFDQAVVDFFTSLVEPLNHIEAHAALATLLRVVSQNRYCPFSRRTLVKRIVTFYLQICFILKKMLEPVAGVGLGTDHSTTRMQRG